MNIITDDREFLEKLTWLAWQFHDAGYVGTAGRISESVPAMPTELFCAVRAIMADLRAGNGHPLCQARADVREAVDALAEAADRALRR